MFGFYVILSIIFGILTLLFAFFSIVCVIKERVAKSTKLSAIATLCSAFVSVVSYMNITVPFPIILPVNNETSNYTDSIDITIESEESSLLQTYYTLDGTDPKEGKIYKDTITISESATICARNKFLWKWSEPAERPYIISSVNDKVNKNVDVDGNNNITITGNVEGDININEEPSPEPASSSEPEILNNELTLKFDFAEAIRHSHSNEQIINKEIICNKENKPTYSSIYPGVRYSQISNKVRLIEVTKGFREFECSRSYYFDENGKLTFALIEDEEGGHRIYFYNDILIRYIDINGETHDINYGLENIECKWTELTLKESYEIFNGVKKSSDSDEFSVVASYDMNTFRSSSSGIDVMINATTSLPAEYVTITAVSDTKEYEPLDMHGGTYDWYFKANFYEKGNYTITVTAYRYDGECVSDEFTFKY